MMSGKRTIFICKIIKLYFLSNIEFKVRVFKIFKMFLLFYIKRFYEINYFNILKFCNLDEYIMNSTMTGITLASTNANPPLYFDQNISECLMLNNFLPNSIKWCLLFSFLMILFMQLNFKIYFDKVKTSIKEKSNTLKLI